MADLTRDRPPDSHAPATALITGAAGFLGSTLAHALLAEGCQVVGLDDLSNGHASSLPLGVPLVKGDVRDPEALAMALQRFGRPPEVIFHLAGLISVAESVAEPERYRSVNAGGTACLVTAALDFGVEAVIQASSAAVLAPLPAADPALAALRLDETAPVAPANPYGESKLAAEQTLEAACDTGRLAAASLRLFNLAGAAFGCRERHAPETHLIPLAIAAARGQRPALELYGGDFDTPDGTAVRDYVHIEDVVAAFIAAAARTRAAQRSGRAGHETFHVGSGVGHSVREVLATVAAVLGLEVPHALRGRRAGDVARLVADPTLMRRYLGVHPDASLARMVRDAAAMG